MMIFFISLKIKSVLIILMERNKTFKIVMLGESGVGKTTLVNCLRFGIKDDASSCPTIGAAFSSKDIYVNNQLVKIHIWDTAGQERFRSLAKMYYRNTSGCFCVFDVTDRNSFEEINYWFDNYTEHNEHNNIILVANKTDKDVSEWKVSEEEIKDLTKKLGVSYVFTNYIDMESIDEMFQQMTLLLLSNTIIVQNKSCVTLVSTKKKNM